MLLHQEDNNMLVRLLPDQISKFWDIIKYALDNAPPLTANQNYKDWTTRILTQALSGKIEVWASYRDEEGQKIFEGVMLTTFTYDSFLDTKDLLIYYVYSYNGISAETRDLTFKTLAKYAKSRGCKRIATYTNNPTIVSWAKDFGGDHSLTLITFDI